MLKFSKFPIFWSRPFLVNQLIQVVYQKLTSKMISLRNNECLKKSKTFSCLRSISLKNFDRNLIFVFTIFCFCFSFFLVIELFWQSSLHPPSNEEIKKYRRIVILKILLGLLRGQLFMNLKNFYNFLKVFKYFFKFKKLKKLSSLKKKTFFQKILQKT